MIGTRRTDTGVSIARQFYQDYAQAGSDRLALAYLWSKEGLPNSTVIAYLLGLARSGRLLGLEEYLKAGHATSSADLDWPVTEAGTKVQLAACYCAIQPDAGPLLQDVVAWIRGCADANGNGSTGSPIRGPSKASDVRPRLEALASRLERIRVPFSLDTLLDQISSGKGAPDDLDMEMAITILRGMQTDQAIGLLLSRAVGPTARSRFAGVLVQLGSGPSGRYVGPLAADPRAFRQQWECLFEDTRPCTEEGLFQVRDRFLEAYE
jgi:hypothetical protein